MPERQYPKHRDTKSPQEKDVFKKGSPQDVTSVRAKNSGHKKKTADKWNQ
jgi:hypothetical protein